MIGYVVINSVTLFGANLVQSDDVAGFISVTSVAGAMHKLLERDHGLDVEGVAIISHYVYRHIGNRKPSYSTLRSSMNKLAKGVMPSVFDEQRGDVTASFVTKVNFGEDLELAEAAVDGLDQKIQNRLLGMRIAGGMVADRPDPMTERRHPLVTVAFTEKDLKGELSKLPYGYALRDRADLIDVNQPLLSSFAEYLGRWPVQADDEDPTPGASPDRRVRHPGRHFTAIHAGYLCLERPTSRPGRDEESPHVMVEGIVGLAEWTRFNKAFTRDSPDSDGYFWTHKANEQDGLFYVTAL